MENNNSIVFVLYPWLEEGLEFVLSNIRKVYDKNEAEIYVFLDDEYNIVDRITDKQKYDNFLKICNRYECIVRNSRNRVWANYSSSYSDESRKRLLEIINRYKIVCRESQAKWLITLEDDVYVRKKITKFPNTDFAFNKNRFFAGGSIVNREKFKDTLESYTDKQLLSYMDIFPFYFAGDQYIKRLLINRGLSYSVFEDHDDIPYVEEGDSAIIHNIKTHYPHYHIEYANFLSGTIDVNPMYKEKPKINYDFIEIGTSDFDNLIEKADDLTIGLSIEPVKVYFDRLPNKKNVKKINCAVSDTDTQMTCYWVDPDDIQKYKLPNWIRGCGTINHEHPLVVTELESRNIKDIYKSNICDVISWNTLINRENIASVSFLKIDAEGSDYSILESILQSDCDVFPEKIQFENKDFINNLRLNNIISGFLKKNYYIKDNSSYDIVLEKIK